MSLPKDDAAILSARWTEGVLLKRDVFSTVERGRFRDDAGEVDAVLRRLDQVPPWSYPLARHLFARERRALALARDLDVGPKLLWAGRQALVRGFIDGVALHLAKPHGDLAYFRSAKLALRKLHRAGICHNDLAKEQNWLRGSDGRAYVTDFQLAACFKTQKPPVPDRGLRGPAASAEAQAQLCAAGADADGAQDPRAQILCRQHLAQDRQEGLPGHHPRPVQLHRSRRRRPPAGQRRACPDRPDPEEP